jgi:ribosome biogenesis GTPase A
MMHTNVPTRDEFLPVLDEAIRQVGEAGGPAGDSSFAADAAKLAELSKRLISGQFHLAVLGQFKRGKSTLLNSLLGEDILPTAVVPLTAMPTWIRFGESPRARVEFSGSAKPEEIVAGGAAELCGFLSRFVTESANPKNRLGVGKVEVYHPATILKDGLVFIDTPGIGSTFRHNTETTLHFLSQCDAAVFLVSADPPITEAEVEFLRQVKPRVHRLFFVLNKLDYLNRAEADQAMKFFRKVLVEQAGIVEDAPIFSVSARDALRAKVAGDAGLWASSGMAEVESYLLSFLVLEKSTALRAAVGQKTLDIVQDVAMRLRLALRSLELPLEDLQSRLSALGQRIEDLHRQRQDAHDLLAGDRRRAHESLERQYEELRGRAQQRLSDALDRELTAAGSKPPDEAALQQTLNAAIPGLFDVEFKEAIQQFDRQLSEVVRPHQQRLGDLVESIRRTAADLFDVPYRPMDNSVTIAAAREPYWLTYRYEDSFGPISPGVIDQLAPPQIRRRRIERRFREKIETLVLYNAGKLREKLYDQIESTFSHFGRQLDERLTAAVAATHGAAQAALARRQSHAGAVVADVDRLRKSAGDLEQTAAQLREVTGRADNSSEANLREVSRER